MWCRSHPAPQSQASGVPVGSPSVCPLYRRGSESNQPTRRAPEAGGNAKLGSIAVKRRADGHRPGGIGMAVERAAAGVEPVDGDTTSAKSNILDQLRVGPVELCDHDVERGPRRSGGIENPEEL